MDITVDNTQHMFELKYRPGTIEECILPASDKAIFKGLVAQGKLPHLVLQSDSPGTGKTTVGLALCNDINANVFFVNGSDCKIDFVRGPLTAFATSLSMDGRPKVIMIDEFDRAGLAEAQRHMRTFMEAYGDNCSVIITANNLDGIIKPIQSRARVIKFGNPNENDSKLMMVEMIKRAMKICELENIEVKAPKALAAIVKQNFPDFRKVTNLIDLYSANKVIDEGILSAVLEQRDMSDLFDVIKDKNMAKVFNVSDKYYNSYPVVVEYLMDKIYPLVNEQSKIQLIEIIGENNQMHGIAGSPKVHLRMLVARLILSMEWI